MNVLEIRKRLTVANQQLNVCLLIEDYKGDDFYLDLDQLHINQETERIYFTGDNDYVVIPKDELDNLKKNQKED